MGILNLHGGQGREGSLPPRIFNALLPSRKKESFYFLLYFLSRFLFRFNFLRILFFFSVDVEGEKKARSIPTFNGRNRRMNGESKEKGGGCGAPFRPSAFPRLSFRYVSHLPFPKLTNLFINYDYDKIEREKLPWTFMGASSSGIEACFFEKAFRKIKSSIEIGESRGEEISPFSIYIYKFIYLLINPQMFQT